MNDASISPIKVFTNVYKWCLKSRLTMGFMASADISHLAIVESRVPHTAYVGVLKLMRRMDSPPTSITNIDSCLASSLFGLLPCATIFTRFIHFSYALPFLCYNRPTPYINLTTLSSSIFSRCPYAL